jgi:hypothetical protein
MRIRENDYDACAAYTEEMKRRVADVFREASQISELKSLLAEIRACSCALRELFLTEKEISEMRGIAADFDKRMQAEVQNVTYNLETYHRYRWKELFDERESGNE